MRNIPTSKVKFSRDYKGALSLRQQLETLLRKEIISSNISSPEELQTFLEKFQAALDAVKSIPYEILSKPRPDFK